MTAPDDPRRVRTDSAARADAARASSPAPASGAPTPPAPSASPPPPAGPAGPTRPPPPPASPAWHALNSAEALEKLGASRTLGLTSAEAAARLERYGPNRVAEAARTSPWQLLFEQFQNVLVIILLVGAAISIALGHQVEAIAIV